MSVGSRREGVARFWGVGLFRLLSFTALGFVRAQSRVGMIDSDIVP